MNRPFINELTLYDMPPKGISEPRHTLPAADMATDSPICTRVFARLCVVESVYDFTVPNGMLTSTSASQRAFSVRFSFSLRWRSFPGHVFVFFSCCSGFLSGFFTSSRFVSAMMMSNTISNSVTPGRGDGGVFLFFSLSCPILLICLESSG